MRPQGSPAELERRRRRAIHLLSEGQPPVEVARRVGVDRRSVRRWKAAYKKRGERGIKAQVHPGPTKKLDDEGRAGLVHVLKGGAMACGYPTDLWTCSRVTAVIQKRFGVSYNVTHTWRVLRSLVWSPQKPQRRAVEASPREKNQWLRETWERAKKKPTD